VARQNVRTKGFAPSANPDMARAMAELRRSSAASRHVPAPRKGTRTAKQQIAIREQLRG
jgi:hypothetical protein